MNARFVDVDQLTDGDVRSMLRLLESHFVGVTDDVFRRDLSEKQHVLLLEHECQLVGFTTLAIDLVHHDGKRTAVVYSGDTIVDPTARASGLLPKAWIRGVLALTARAQVERTRWLLIVSGWRTYRFLPVFFKRFLPRYEDSASEEERWFRDACATRRFGERFAPGRGIVTLAHPQPLQPDAAEVPANRRNDPHVAYFLSANPGHINGDELVCLTELHEDNLTPAGRRALGLERMVPTS